MLALALPKQKPNRINFFSLLLFYTSPTTLVQVESSEYREEASLHIEQAANNNQGPLSGPNKKTHYTGG